MGITTQLLAQATVKVTDFSDLTPKSYTMKIWINHTVATVHPGDPRSKCLLEHCGSVDSQTKGQPLLERFCLLGLCGRNRGKKKWFLNASSSVRSIPMARSFDMRTVVISQSLCAGDLQLASWRMKRSSHRRRRTEVKVSRVKGKKVHSVRDGTQNRLNMLGWSLITSEACPLKEVLVRESNWMPQEVQPPTAQELRLMFKAFADAKDRWKIDGATMKAECCLALGKRWQVTSQRYKQIIFMYRYVQ